MKIDTSTADLRELVTGMLQSATALAFSEDRGERVESVKEMLDQGHSILEQIDDIDEALESMADDKAPAQAVTTASPSPSAATTSAPAQSVAVGDDAMVQVRSGDLRRLVNLSRRFIRYAKEGGVPSKVQRNYLRRAIKRVKHLIRQPDFN